MVSYWAWVIVVVAAEAARIVGMAQIIGAADAAKEERGLVIDELAATVGQDRWAAVEARPLLLFDAPESHPPQRVFGSMVRRIAALPAG